MPESKNNSGGGGMKSALEIALERTKNISAGEDPNALTDEQKQQLREINLRFDEQIAKLELDFTQRIRSMVENYGEAEVRDHLAQFQNELRSERARINTDRQAEIQAYMDSIGK